MFAHKAARVVEGRDPKFNHVFGGPRKHLGVTPQGCTKPLHLIYTFDTKDESFPVRIPGIRHLPLYYSFVYNAGACGYRMKAENEIEVLYMETKKVESNFPYDDYPSEFPMKQIQILPITYEQHKTLVFYLEADKEGLNAQDRDLILNTFHYPFTQLGGIHRMWQGIPSVACPNKSCPNSRFSCFMEVFAVIWNQPHPGAFLWEKEDDGGNDTQVIFQICPTCFSMHACNRCT